MKDFIVPGSIPFFIAALLPGVLLLFRKKDGGRAGKTWVTALVLLYWMFSTPVTAVALVDLLSPNPPPVMSKADARGATAIVLLGAGMDVHRSRGDSYGAPTREGALRVLEAARLHRLLGGAPIIASGGLGSPPYSEDGLITRRRGGSDAPSALEDWKIDRLEDYCRIDECRWGEYCSNPPIVTLQSGNILPIFQSTNLPIQRFRL